MESTFQVAIPSDEETNGLLTVFATKEHIDRYPIKIFALEVCDLHVPRLCSNGFYLNLMKSRFLRATHKQVISFGVAIRELRIESASQQLAHNKIFAGIPSRNPGLPLLDLRGHNSNLTIELPGRRLVLPRTQSRAA